MPNFQPAEPEKKVKLEITARESHLLKILRTVRFGDVVVKKVDGMLIRVEPKASIMLEEQPGVDYAEEQLKGG